MNFSNIIDNYSWDEIANKLDSVKEEDVLKALSSNGNGGLDDFIALISPLASKYIEQMAQLSFSLTRKRFGKTIQMYIPMYLSNECQNICTYCGFSFHNKIPRITLSEKQILKEVKVIKDLGFDHILLVSGEANKTVGTDYFKKAIELIKPYFSSISLEVQPLEEDEYRALKSSGLNTVLVYQETYNKLNYKKHHPKGKKSNFDYRLNTPDRLGKANIHKIGLGVLLGLEDWRIDSIFTFLHLQYLEKKYWQTKYSISFPRLRPAEGIELPKEMISDKELVQLICAYRIVNENLELSLSTREAASFRDNLFQLGITTVSAGSKTEPGGYALKNDALEQFEISDERTPKEVVKALKNKDLEAVWKDWDRVMS